MKKIKLNIGVLKLKREEISSLTNSEMKNVVGGLFDGDGGTTNPPTVTSRVGSAACPGQTSHHC
jgi:hypothetical protein